MSLSNLLLFGTHGAIKRIQDSFDPTTPPGYEPYRLMDPVDFEMRLDGYKITVHLSTIDAHYT